MRVEDWFQEQLETFSPAQRERVGALIEDLDERQAIVDESRNAESEKHGASDRVTQWIREMHPAPVKMGKDLREGANAGERAIFTSHLMQPAKPLDDAISKYSSRIVTPDSCRSTFRKVPA